MATCDCGAEITFVLMAETGKRMPVDLLPVTAIVPVVSADPKLDGKYVTIASTSRRPVYLPHWASCPERQKFKRKR